MRLATVHGSSPRINLTVASISYDFGQWNGLGMGPTVKPWGIGNTGNGSTISITVLNKLL